MFKRTRSLSNAVCYDTNASACAYDFLSLCLLLSNLLPFLWWIKMYIYIYIKCINSTSGGEFVTEKGFNDIFCIWRRIIALRYCFWPISGNFSLRVHSFVHFYTSGLKFYVIWIQRASFSMETRSFRARDTIFGDFCDDNVCACAEVHVHSFYFRSHICQWKRIQRPRFSTWREHFASIPTFAQINKKAGS